jgi:hypothetical protein
MGDLETVAHIAGLPLPPLNPSPADHCLKCLRALATLPHRQSDAIGGALSLGLYRRHLASWPADALSFLAAEATLTCRWMPTIAECMDILSRWKRDDPFARAQRRAKWLLREEAHNRREAALHRLRLGQMGQAEFDSLPERWQAIAECQGLVRRDGERRIVRGKP